MKEVFLLTKILLKSSMSPQKQIYQKKGSFLKILGWILIYLYIEGIIGFFSFEIISALKAVGQEAVFLNLCLVVILGFTVMRTLFSSINILFFSKDTEFLLPLPVESYKIVIAKINCLIISEYIMSFIILVPAILVYGVLLNLSICFYIVALFVVLLFPIVPMMLVSLIMTVIMKFTNIFRNKDFVQYITVVLSLVFIIGVQFLAGTDAQITTEELANRIVETNGLVEMYTKSFITLKPTMSALINYNNVNGIKNLFVLALLTVITYIAVICIMSKLYIKTVTNTVGGKTSRKQKKDKKTYEKRMRINAYVKKEFQNLVRNPIYFMQCVVPSFLLPVIIGVSIYMGMKAEGIGDISQIQNELANIMITPIGMAGCTAVIIFFFMLNYVSVTSISRDGENAVFMKYIPVSLEKQCLYKILPGIILNFIPMIIITVALKVLLQEKIVAEVLVAINVIAFLVNVFNNYIMILIDLKNPKLNWTTEYAVVKQNINILWEVLIYLAEIIACIGWGLFIQIWSFFVVTVCMFLFVGIKKIREYIQKNEYKLFEKVN